MDDKPIIVMTETNMGEATHVQVKEALQTNGYTVLTVSETQSIVSATISLNQVQTNAPSEPPWWAKMPTRDPKNDQNYLNLRRRR